jgi:peroxiredoxin
MAIKRSFTLGLLLALALLQTLATAGSSQSPKANLKLLGDKNETVSLNQLCERQSKPNTCRVVLSFFGSDCSVCAKEAPRLLQYLKQRNDPSIAFYLVSTDSALMRAQVKAFVAKYAPGQDVILDESGSVSDSFGVHRVPSLFVLNNQGQAMGHIEGSHKDLEARLDKLLNAR